MREDEVLYHSYWFLGAVSLFANANMKSGLLSDFNILVHV